MHINIVNILTTWTLLYTYLINHKNKKLKKFVLLFFSVQTIRNIKHNIQLNTVKYFYIFIAVVSWRKFDS